MFVASLSGEKLTFHELRKTVLFQLCYNALPAILRGLKIVYLA